MLVVGIGAEQAPGVRAALVHLRCHHSIPGEAHACPPIRRFRQDTPRWYILGYVRGYTKEKDAYLTRLRRIEGQIRGLQRMVEEDVYCIDVLTQVSAATRALQSVALGLLEDHLGHCVAEAVENGGPEADEKVKEASAAIARLVRS